jgi:GNAT superfamily N-acetyltransferase
MKTAPPTTPSLTFRELQYREDDLALLERFYEEIYVPEFPSRDERESLDNMKAYLRLKAEGWYGGNNYHVILGLAGGKAVAGAFADYLDEPNSGVIEFLVVAPASRGGGVGGRLLAETEQRLANDARRLGRSGLDAVAAEMNDPFRPGRDSMDGFIRAAIWDRWGFGRLDFPYIQPALSADQAPVDGLLLIAKPGRSDLKNALPSSTVKAMLRGYMRWAMRIDTPAATAEYQAMARHLTADTVPICGLAAYTGSDAARPLVVHEVTEPADADFAAALCVYRRGFEGGPTDLDPACFRAALLQPADAEPMRYHFWAIRRRADSPVEGMASFFTFALAGFGGYIALEGALRNTRRFPLLLARIEHRMIRDQLGAVGWYIECDPRQEALFARHGFHTVDVRYAQPPLPGVPAYSPAEAPPLCLMYKEFGRSFAAPNIPVPGFCDSMARIFHAVYGIGNVAQSPFYAQLCAAAKAWPDRRVRFRSPAG